MYPALTYEDVGAALAWLTKAFGFEGRVLDDADGHYERAKAAGADLQGEPHDYGDGYRGYSARDLEGNLWTFGTERPSVALAAA